jgi:hypothetical protein
MAMDDWLSLPNALKSNWKSAEIKDGLSMRNWISTGGLAQLIDEYAPVKAADIRELCESGTIPPKYAKRKPGRERGHWYLNPQGALLALEDLLGLNHQQVNEITIKLAALGR